MKKGIYLDHHATTPVHPRALEAMLPYFSEQFGNPMSGSHAWGWEASTAVEKARARVAALLGAEPREIVFTSGATESLHLAILGLLKERGEPSHIITAATEHKATLEVCRRAQREGHAISVLGVDGYGHIDLEDIRRAIRPDTALITLLHGNNEIGTLHPIAQIGALAREHGIPFHVDAAQTAGRHPIDVRAMNIDLLSLSAHKLYGPKGTGALFIRQSPLPRIHLLPYLVGGGQELGLRGGTHNVPGIVGLGAACEIAGQSMADEQARLIKLRDRMISRLTMALDEVVLNGDPSERLCNNVNITINGISPDRILVALPDVAFSSGSACSSASAEGSHVLYAISGTGTTRGNSAAPGTRGSPPRSSMTATLRFGLGLSTTQDEIDSVTDRLIACARRAPGTTQGSQTP